MMLRDKGRGTAAAAADKPAHSDVIVGCSQGIKLGIDAVCAARLQLKLSQ